MSPLFVNRTLNNCVPVVALLRRHGCVEDVCWTHSLSGATTSSNARFPWLSTRSNRMENATSLRTVTTTGTPTGVDTAASVTSSTKERLGPAKEITRLNNVH